MECSLEIQKYRIAMKDFHRILSESKYKAVRNYNDNPDTFVEYFSKRIPNDLAESDKKSLNTEIINDYENYKKFIALYGYNDNIGLFKTTMDNFYIYIFVSSKRDITDYERFFNKEYKLFSSKNIEPIKIDSYTMDYFN